MNRDGWYIMKNGRTHVGPFKTRAEAEQVVADNPAKLPDVTVEWWDVATAHQKD